MALIIKEIDDALPHDLRVEDILRILDPVENRNELRRVDHLGDLLLH